MIHVAKQQESVCPNHVTQDTMELHVVSSALLIVYPVPMRHLVLHVKLAGLEHIVNGVAPTVVVGEDAIRQMANAKTRAVRPAFITCTATLIVQTLVMDLEHVISLRENVAIVPFENMEVIVT